MRKFIKFILVVLLGFSFISSVFAYDLSNNEKSKLDVIVQKLETIISSRGESYRNIFISKLVDIKNKSSNNEKLRAYVDYIILEIDSINDFNCLIDGSCISKDITCSLGYDLIDGRCVLKVVTNKNCTSTEQIVNLHLYKIPNLKNGESVYSYFTLNNGGIGNYRQYFTCNNGLVITNGNEIIDSCKSGYDLNDGRCVLKVVTNKNCTSTEQIVNGHNYSISSMNNGENKSFSYLNNSITTYPYLIIPTPVSTYKQYFTCNNGVVSKNGEEIIDSCKSGYDLINGSCVIKLNTNKSCDSHIENINGYIFNVPSQISGNSISVYSDYNNDLKNPINLYFYCNDGITINNN